MTGLDYVPALLERGRERAVAERVDIDLWNRLEQPGPIAVPGAYLESVGVRAKGGPENSGPARPPALYSNTITARPRMPPASSCRCASALRSGG